MPLGNRSLLDPRMTTRLMDDWSSSCTIQIATGIGGTSLSGQRFPSSAWANVTGMTNIPCRIAAREDADPTDKEQRSALVTQQSVNRTIKLNGYFPTILPQTYRAVVDGVIYHIRGVEHDSERYSTRLLALNITPQNESGIP